MRDIQVLDSFIATEDIGRGAPTIFLHGNPTSSRVWRDVLPHVPGRRLAPDLIGMGRSGKPAIAYRFADHARYLDAWFDAVAPVEPVTLVGYDWGGALAMDWAARHAGRVRALVAFETFFAPIAWSSYPPQGAQLFRALRTPGVGEGMAREFLARSLANGIRRGVTAVDEAAYLAPYLDDASLRPVLQWPRELPIDGEPPDVVAVVERYRAWLEHSPATPKLVLTFDAPSVLAPPPWVRTCCDVIGLPPAGHHAPEDVPVEIAEAIVRWSVSSSPL